MSPHCPLLLVVAAIGGCAMHGDEATSGHRGDEAFEVQPAPDRAVLIVSRERDGPSPQCGHRVSIDSRQLAELRPGDWVTVYPRAGPHVLRVSASGGVGCSGSGETAVVLSAREESALRTLAGSNGQMSFIAAVR